MMPMVSIGMAKVFQYSSSQTSGIVLLGCVSGGQASNLFTMIAGGDVALSIMCTLTSTLVGVVATPFLTKWLLGTVVSVDSIAVLKSVASLVLVPLTLGLTIGNLTDDFTTEISSVCPVIGVLSTLVLCAGGAANSALLLGGYDVSSFMASCLLPIIGGLCALIFTRVGPFHKMTSSSRRALVIETLSKSPTLAYVLALKHFNDAAKIPAAGMVSLAMIGALVASIWSMIEQRQ
jgi:BASS family bile acid:Na+ symporter